MICLGKINLQLNHYVFIMRNCNFTIETEKDVDLLFMKAVNQGKKFNATIQGNAKSGVFEIEILGVVYKGNYSSMGNKINFLISNKPIYVSCKLIQSMIQSYVNNM